jgi:integrase
MPPIRLHDVRHTYASVGLRNATGWHEVKVISQRLGHSSVGFTLDTYAHVLPSADEQTGAHARPSHPRTRRLMRIWAAIGLQGRRPGSVVRL